MGIPSVFRSVVSVIAACVLAASGFARDGGPTVGYFPTTKNVEGDQPLTESYDLKITSPAGLSTAVTITPQVFLISAPEGVSEDAALSYVTLGAETLSFSGGNIPQFLPITISVPEGSAAGDYAWGIRTVGWPSVMFENVLTPVADGFAFINAKITVPQSPAAPSVVIAAPLDTATFNYVIGSAPLQIPLSFAATAPGVSPISGVDADLNGVGIQLSADGIGTDAVTATGTIQVSVTQTTTFTVTARATNTVDTSFDTVEITVNAIDGPPPPPPGEDCDIEWLPPISLGKVQKGGSVVPIKFALHCDCGNRKRDTSVVIAIYEIFANGSSSQPVLYPYGPGSPNRPDFALNPNGQYHLNFPTAAGAHRYHIDVYRPAIGPGAPQLLGTKEFSTR